MTEPRTPFHDLTDYLALPRVTGLLMAPDGARLVASVQQLSVDRSSYQTSLWEVDPAGAADACRLTHSEQGESAPAFLSDGSLLFTSTRPGPGEPAGVGGAFGSLRAGGCRPHPLGWGRDTATCHPGDQPATIPETAR